MGIWIDYENNVTYTFINYSNKFITKKYDFIASRGTNIMNDFIKYLEEEKRIYFKYVFFIYNKFEKNLNQV